MHMGSIGDNVLALGVGDEMQDRNGSQLLRRLYILAYIWRDLLAPVIIVHMYV